MASRILDRAIDRYVALESEIARLLSGKFDAVCRTCTEKCCYAGFAAGTIRSWFLREASHRVHGKWWPDDWEGRGRCVALGANGCLLRVGRPTTCRSFMCAAYLAAAETVWEVIFVAAISHLIDHAQRVTRRLNLGAATAKELEACREAVAERIEQAHELLARAKRLVDPEAGDLEKHEIVLRLLAAMPAILSAGVCRALGAKLGG